MFFFCYLSIRIISKLSTKTGSNEFTGIFGVQIETRDSNGKITDEQTFEFTETLLALDEDVDLHWRPLTQDNTGGSGNIEIKFHSAYYEHYKGAVG